MYPRKFFQIILITDKNKKNQGVIIFITSYKNLIISASYNHLYIKFIRGKTDKGAKRC